jgi:hypothetical protein
MSRPSLVRDLAFGAVFPIAILAAGVFGFVALGEAKPERKAEAGKDYASLLKMLPEAEVAKIEAFDTSKQSLDIELQRQCCSVSRIDDRRISHRPCDVYKDPNCRQGRYVTKGQVLFRIDPQDYELEVQRLAGMEERVCAKVQASSGSRRSRHSEVIGSGYGRIEIARCGSICVLRNCVKVS